MGVNKSELLVLKSAHEAREETWAQYFTSDRFYSRLRASDGIESVKYSVSNIFLKLCRFGAVGLIM